MMKKLI